MISIAFLVAFAADPNLRSPEDFLPAGAVSRVGTAQLARPIRSNEAIHVSADGATAVFVLNSSSSTRPSPEWWDLHKGKRVPPPFPLPAGSWLAGIIPAGVIMGHEFGYELRDLKTGRVLFVVQSEERLFRNSQVPVFDRKGTMAISRTGIDFYLTKKLPDETYVSTKLPIPIEGMWTLAQNGLSITWVQGNEIKRYELTTGETKTITKLDDPHSIVSSLEASPDGSTIMVTRRDRNYDFPPLFQLYFGTNPVAKKLNDMPEGSQYSHFRFTDDGQELYISNGPTAYIWNVATGEVVAEYVSKSARNLIPLHDARKLLQVDLNGSLSIIEWRTQRMLTPAVKRLPAFAFTRWIDSNTVIGVQTDGNRQTAEQSIQVSQWNPTQRDARVQTRAMPEKAISYPVAISPTGQSLIITGYHADKRLFRFYNTQSQTLTSEFADVNGDSFFGPYSPDGKWLLARKNGQTGIYNADASRCFVTLTMNQSIPSSRRPGPGGGGGGGRSLSWSNMQGTFSPDGRLVYIAAPSNGLIAFETATGMARYSIQPGNMNDRRNNTSGVAFALSGDGRRAVMEVFARATLLDPTTGTVIRNLEFPAVRGRYSEVGSMSLSHTGRWLAVANGDTQDILIYDLSGPLPELIHTFRGATGSIVHLSLSPDDRNLLSSSSDGTAITWNLGTIIDRYLQRIDTNPEERWWSELAGDANQAGKVMTAMINHNPTRAVSLLAERLTPAVEADQSLMKESIKQLDSDDPAVREAAYYELMRVLDQAESLIRENLKGTPSGEVRKKLSTLLSLIEGPETNPAQNRNLRAVEVLERIGTAPARKALLTLSKGPPQARLTREAKQSFERLEKKP